jgi:hypothetical protein
MNQTENFRDVAAAQANGTDVYIESLAREARALRVPMTHTTRDDEFMPVLSYRVDQEIAAAEERIEALRRLRDRYSA